MLGHDFRGAALFHLKFCSSPESVQGSTSRTYRVKSNTTCRLSLLLDLTSTHSRAIPTQEQSGRTSGLKETRDLNMKHEAGWSNWHSYNVVCSTDKHKEAYTTGTNAPHKVEEDRFAQRRQLASSKCHHVAHVRCCKTTGVPRSSAILP